MKAKIMPQQAIKATERQWTQKLQEQVSNWQSAKHDGRYLTAQGVPVVHRHRRNMAKRSAA